MTKIITTEEIEENAVASLPTRPTESVSFGGKGYTSSEMKAAFDKLSLFIIERFNSLLEDVSSEGEGSLADEIPTGVYDGHTLSRLFADIVSGDMPLYLSMGDESLSDMKVRLCEEIASLEERIEICLLHMSDSIIDASVPQKRDLTNGEVTV